MRRLPCIRAQNPNERNGRSDTGGISDSSSGGEWTGAALSSSLKRRSEAVRWAECSWFCRVLSGDLCLCEKTTCRNKIEAHSEMNPRLCGLITDSSCLPSILFSDETKSADTAQQKQECFMKTKQEKQKLKYRNYCTAKEEFTNY